MNPATATWMKGFATNMKTQKSSSTAEGPVGLIIRQKDPSNLEMPFDQLDEFVTPSVLTVLHPQPFPRTRVGSSSLSIVDMGRGAERAEPELSSTIGVRRVEKALAIKGKTPQ